MTTRGYMQGICYVPVFPWNCHKSYRTADSLDVSIRLQKSVPFVEHMFHHRWISVLRLLKSKMPMGNPLIATGKTSTDYLQCVDVPCHHQTYRIGDAPPGLWLKCHSSSSSIQHVSQHREKLQRGRGIIRYNVSKAIVNHPPFYQKFMIYPLVN